MVLEWFLGPKIHAKSETKKSVRQAKSIVKTILQSMSALLEQTHFRMKIREELYVFWKVDLKDILK